MANDVRRGGRSRADRRRAAVSRTELSRLEGFETPSAASVRVRSALAKQLWRGFDRKEQGDRVRLAAPPFDSGRRERPSSVWPSATSSKRTGNSDRSVD